MAVKSRGLVLDERFRALSRCAPIGIFTTDADGRTTYVNPRYEEICGFALTDCLRRGWASFLHPDDRQAASAEWSRCAREGHEYVHEHRFVGPMGEVRWVRTRAAPMLEDGRLIGHVGAVEDITDEKGTEIVRAESEARRRVGQALVGVVGGSPP